MWQTVRLLPLENAECAQAARNSGQADILEISTLPTGCRYRYRPASTNRATPMNLLNEMILDMDVARHKREIAEGFQQARERLGLNAPPAQPCLTQKAYYDSLRNGYGTGQINQYAQSNSNFWTALGMNACNAWQRP